MRFEMGLQFQKLLLMTKYCRFNRVEPLIKRLDIKMNFFQILLDVIQTGDPFFYVDYLGACDTYILFKEAQKS